MRIGILVAGTWIALAGAGGLAFAQPKNSQPAAAPTAPAAKSPAAASEPPEITLVDPGQRDGRRELRLKPAKGVSTTFTMTMTQSTEVTMPGGEPTNTPTPGMAMTMTCVIDKVEANGDFQSTTTVTDVKPAKSEGLDQGLVDATKSAYEKMRGMKFVLLTTDRGFTKPISMDFPNADPAMKQTMDGMMQSMSQNTIPLPKEAVGVGAIWKSKVKVSMLGCLIDTTAQYTVKALTATTAVLDVVVTQSAKDQEMSFPGLPAGSMKVKSMSGEGKGTMTTATDMGLATGMKMTTSSTMDMEISMQGTTSAMKSASTVVIALDALPANPEVAPPAEKR